MWDEAQVAEFTHEIILSQGIDNCKTICETPVCMAKPETKTITFRPSLEDRRLVNKLAGKLGIKTSQVIKIALRKFAESEGLQLRAS